MNYLDWHVGMKVVFIGWRGSARNSLGVDQSAFVEGAIFTITNLRLMRAGDQLCHNGLICTIRKDLLYVGLLGMDGLLFAAVGFRPIQTRKTDISIFTQMLDKAPEPAL